MSQYIVKTKKTYLKSPLSASASSIVLRSFVDTKDNALTLADFGAYGVIVVKQGTTIEMIKFDGLSTASDGTVTLTVATNGRNLDCTTPYAGSSTGNAFQSGAEVIVTNDPLTVSQFGNINNANTWALLQTFTVAPRTAVAPVDDDDVTNKAYVDATVAGSYPANRIVVNGTAGETITEGQLVYLKPADGKWWLCDADTASTVDNVLLALAQGAGVADGAIAGGVLIRGYDDNQTGLTANNVYYASNTAGAISNSAGTTEVTIGFSLSTTEIYFSPRFNQSITEDQQDALEGTVGTPSATNKYVTNDDTEGTGNVVRKSLINTIQKFGGDGSDGALNVTSGTTTIDLGSSAVVTKNYTSINISSGATVDFSNPHANGTIIIFKSQGDVTIAGTLDASGMGASGGSGGAGGTSGGSGSNGSDGNEANFIIDDDADHAGGGGSTASGTSGGAGGTGGTILKLYSLYSTSVDKINSSKSIRLVAGSGGAGGGGGGSNVSPGTAGSGGDGGNGGGAVYVECNGALTFSGTINTSGLDGQDGGSISDNKNVGAGGAGGGGSAGLCLVLYNTLTSNTGTVTATGGAGGTGGNWATGDGAGKDAGGGGGGAGAGSLTFAGGGGGAGGNSQQNGTNGSNASGTGAGAGGGGGAGAYTTNGGTRSGGAGGTGGATSGGLEVENTIFA